MFRWFFRTILKIIAWILFIIPGFFLTVLGLAETGLNADILSKPAGAIWSGFDTLYNASSLQTFQPAVERYLTPILWDSFIFPMLKISPVWWFLIGLLILFVARSLFGRRDDY